MPFYIIFSSLRSSWVPLSLSLLFVAFTGISLWYFPFSWTSGHPFSSCCPKSPFWRSYSDWNSYFCWTRNFYSFKFRYHHRNYRKSPHPHFIHLDPHHPIRSPAHPPKQSHHRWLSNRYYSLQSLIFAILLLVAYRLSSSIGSAGLFTVLCSAVTARDFLLWFLFYMQIYIKCLGSIWNGSFLWCRPGSSS